MLLLGLLAAAVAARLPGLADGLWIDEVVSLDTAAEPWGRLLARTGFGDVHPPLYYALLKAWTAAFGATDLSARLLSLLCGLGTVGLLFAWLRGRLGSAGAVLGAGLLAWSGLHAHYSVEVRAYALLALLTLGAVVAAERWVARPTGRRLAAAAALMALAAWTHAFGLAVAALLTAYVLLGRDRPPGARRAWGVAAAAALAAFSPWLPLLVVQATALPAGVTAHLGDGLPVADALGAWGPAPGLGVPWASAAAGLAVLALAALGAARLPDVPREPGAPAPSPALGALAAALGVALVGPLVPLVALPLSETTLDLLVGALPATYALLATALAGLLAAVAATERLPRLPRLSAPAVVAGGLALGLAALLAVRPVLTVRNQLLVLPLATALAAVPLAGRGRAALVALGAAVALAVPSLAFGAGTFLPRQDFRGAAAVVGAAPAWVVPRWDAPGLARYLPPGSPVAGALAPDELPPPSALPPRLALVFTRQVAAPGDPVAEAFLARAAAGRRVAADERRPGLGAGVRVVVLEPLRP